MYYLYGADYCVRMIYRLAKAHNEALEISSFDALRGGYLNFLEVRQEKNKVNHKDDIFIRDASAELALAKSFSQASLNDLNQEHVVGDAYEDGIRNTKLKVAEEALSQLLTRDENLALVFGLAIHSIFVRAYQTAPGIMASHGGSSSGSIGAIWLAVNDGISERDLMEMYVHELTHHLLFIDELNFPQFNYEELTKKHNFTTSAILKRPRPLDKAVHSIVVSTELVLARNSIFGWHDALSFHPATLDLIESTLFAIDELKSKANASDLMSKHMLSIVADCKDALYASRLEVVHECQ